MVDDGGLCKKEERGVGNTFESNYLLGVHVLGRWTDVVQRHNTMNQMCHAS